MLMTKYQECTLTLKKMILYSKNILRINGSYIGILRNILDENWTQQEKLDKKYKEMTVPLLTKRDEIAKLDTDLEEVLAKTREKFETLTKPLKEGIDKKLELVRD